jgi:hypothetical protein
MLSKNLLLTSKQLLPYSLETQQDQTEETTTLELHFLALEETVSDQARYMFPPVDLKQPEGTKRAL